MDMDLAGGEHERFQRHSRHVVPDVDFLEGFCARELDFGRRFHALHVQGGVQTFKDGPSVGLGTQDLKLALGLGEFYL